MSTFRNPKRLNKLGVLEPAMRRRAAYAWFSLQHAAIWGATGDRVWVAR